MNISKIEEEFDKEFPNIEFAFLMSRPTKPEDIKKFYRQKIEDMLDEIRIKMLEAGVGHKEILLNIADLIIKIKK